MVPVYTRPSFMCSVEMYYFFNQQAATILFVITGLRSYLYLELLTSSAIPHKQKSGMLIVQALVTKKEANRYLPKKSYRAPLDPG